VIAWPVDASVRFYLQSVRGQRVQNERQQSRQDIWTDYRGVLVRRPQPQSLDGRDGPTQ
jgi:hypothetical protein